MPEIPAPIITTSSSVTVELAVEPMVRNVDSRSVGYDLDNEVLEEEKRIWVDIKPSRVQRGMVSRYIWSAKEDVPRMFYGGNRAL